MERGKRRWNEDKYVRNKKVKQEREEGNRPI